jgi:hypothetical protein
VALAGVSVLPLVWRDRWRLARPLLLMLAGALATVGVLLARGPGDWASASSSLKLYSFPTMVMALGFSLAILSAVQAPAAPATLAGGPPRSVSGPT